MKPDYKKNVLQIPIRPNAHRTGLNLFDEEILIK